MRLLDFGKDHILDSNRICAAHPACPAVKCNAGIGVCRLRHDILGPVMLRLRLIFQRQCGIGRIMQRWDDMVVRADKRLRDPAFVHEPFHRGYRGI